jgi:hypothetical protein
MILSFMKRVTDLEMNKAEMEPEAPLVPARVEFGRALRLCVGGWLVPGLGHLMLGRKWRAVILFVSIIAMFLLGLAMKGEFFARGSPSYLEALGYFGEMAVGLAMPAARFFGYSGGDPFFVSSDYGTAFLVSAGMLNILAILDAYDIAARRKS